MGQSGNPQQRALDQIAKQMQQGNMPAPQGLPAIQMRVPWNPLPTDIELGINPTTKTVSIVFHTPQGMSAFFLDADTAIKIFDAGTKIARQAKAGIVPAGDVR